MRKTVFAVMCALVLSSAGAFPAHAVTTDPGGGFWGAEDGCVQPGEGMNRPNQERQHAKRMAVLARKLGLSEEQKAKAREIIDAERAAVRPLREKLIETRKSLRTLTETVPFDEAAIRQLIASTEGIRTDIMVAHAKARSQLFALLTPEQQAKAKSLRVPFDGGGRRRGR